ncbi:MAG: hypothetical protein NTU90_02595, partial [Proteobacteria bacterium]|nr:hypothetical protein [Pseudomonadota bacterium]
MKRYGLDRVITFFIGGLIFSLFLAGCSSALKYPGTAGVDTGKMTPYQKGSINVLIPPDYIEDVLLESNKQEGMMFKVLGANAKQAVFRKKDSSGIITVLCWDGLSFVPNNQLNEIARSGVTKNLSEGKLAAGTYEFGSGFFKT